MHLTALLPKCIVTSTIIHFLQHYRRNIFPSLQWQSETFHRSDFNRINYTLKVIKIKLESSKDLKVHVE